MAANTINSAGYALLPPGVQLVPDPVMGGAAEFDGISAGILIPHDSAYEPAVGTIEAFTYTSELQDSDIIGKTTDQWVRSNLPSGGSVYVLRVLQNGGALGCIGVDDPATGPWVCVWSRSSMLRTNKWHLISLSWDGTFLALYVDGKFEVLQAYNPVPNLGLSYSGSTDLGIGHPSFWGGTPNHKFKGRLADVRIYRGARSPENILQDYQSTRKR